MGKVDPKQFEFGQSKSQLHATFGLPDGCNAQHPKQFTRSHEKAPVLPDRESCATLAWRLHWCSV